MSHPLKTTLIIFVALLFAACDKNNSDNDTSTKNSTLSTSNPGNFSMGDHYIPPIMPNPITSDLTLLGVDSNNNGVRDDVENYIYDRFKGYKNYKVEREIAMQWARAAQLLIQNPENGYKDKKYLIMQKVISCQEYYYNSNTQGYDFQMYMQYINQHEIFDEDFKDVIFNTKQRLKAYFKYSESMSGHVFDDMPDTKDNCDFDADLLIEGRL
jgi:hypothetical protein